MNSEVHSQVNLHVQIVRGVDADLLVAQEAFRAEWCGLWERCPWATAYQTYGFARAWYHSYCNRFEPCLILTRTDDGGLQGLLALAISIGGKEIVVAGGHQAEYQAWICLPHLAETFPPMAIEAARHEAPGSTFAFRYLPRNTPADWVKASTLKRTCVLKAYRRPLLCFGDGQEIAGSLKKSTNRRKLSRLRKMGGMDFRKLTDEAQLGDSIHSMIQFHDARRIAVNGWAPFEMDNCKRTFHLAMMREPGLLHTTVLEAGGQIASIQLNVTGKKQVQLGLIAHNPFMANYSPGKLHILLLAQMLMKEGYESIDLTPGGDSYKERFANDWDEVQLLMVLPTPRARMMASIRLEGAAASRSVLSKLQIEPARARFLAEKLRHIVLARPGSTLAAGARRWAGSRRETRIYRCDAAVARQLQVSEVIRRDALDDLLVYRPAENGLTRREFVSNALLAIEDDQHFYTYAEERRLLQVGWVVERPAEKLLGRLLPGFKPRANSALVHGLHTMPEGNLRKLDELCLRTMIRDAACAAGTEQVYVILSPDAASSIAVEELGLVHEASHMEQVRFGHRRRWISSPQPLRAKPSQANKPDSMGVRL